MPSGAPETRHLREKDVTGFDHQLTTRHEAVFGLGARILGCCPILLCGRGRQNRRVTVISFSPPRMTDFFANHASRLSWKTEEDEWDRRADRYARRMRGPEYGGFGRRCPTRKIVTANLIVQ